MNNPAVSGRRYFTKSVADGAKIADCPAGADCDCLSTMSPNFLP